MEHNDASENAEGDVANEDVAITSEQGDTLQNSLKDSSALEMEESNVGRRTSIFKYYSAYKKKDMRSVKKGGPLIGVIDVGTRTIRFVIFNAKHVTEVTSHQIDIEQITPFEGWVEQDPNKIISLIQECIDETVNKLIENGMNVNDIVTVGITNQRETTIAWDVITGDPLYNAILWSDVRTEQIADQIIAKFPNKNKNHLKHLCGLPVSSYFSALKICWLKEKVPIIKKAIRQNRCRIGTVDTWIIWNLTGGINKGLYITDVTNASRTMLMNIETLSWDPTLCRYFDIPIKLLPTIRSSSEIYGRIKVAPLTDIPISGILGNQQSALVGQHCLKKGQAKNTCRHGCFLLCNTGHDRIYSSHGLVTTVAYQFGPKNLPVYALEGSIAVAGTAIRWLRDNMKLLQNVDETEQLAQSVFSTGDVYFVPAFAGLYAPYWRQDARGVICGLTAFSRKEHIIRAALEAVCFQTRDILEAMHMDCGFPLTKLNTDGKLSTNNLLMQLLSDICGIPVFRSTMHNITALGAAMAAGSASGIDLWHLQGEEVETVPAHTFLPTTIPEERDARYKKWKMAVERSLGWATIQVADMTGTKPVQLESEEITYNESRGNIPYNKDRRQGN